MLAVEWRSTARADLLAIIDYISDDNPDAAQALKDEIESKILMLRKHPMAFRQGRVEGTREWIVRSNYVVVYRADARTITILRILHAAQQWP